ncbi:MAG: hypothetical protein O3B38_02665 [Chloroflexi bacterium]|nr:hypothetical protein [Chloroflexota bacterium]MDA1217071.1 hypothetical protein [Chloroflexota bacterium]
MHLVLCMLEGVAAPRQQRGVARAAPVDAACNPGWPRCGQLWSETVRLLRLGERMGRIVTTDPAEIGATRSRMKAEERLYAYHRQICKRCASPFNVLKIGGRPIWYCPSCQPARAALQRFYDPRGLRVTERAG